MKIKEIDNSLRPREKLINLGKENLSIEELIAIILKTGIKNKSCKDLSIEVLNTIKSLDNLKNININTFNNIKGLGKVKTIELIASIELGKRIYIMNNNNDNLKLNNPEVIYNNYKYLFLDSNQELFYCLYLNSNNQLIDKKLLFKGTLNSSTVHPREIFKEAILCSANTIICIHNHPSNNITPSKEDIELTKALITTGNIIGIKLLDHLIFTNNNYHSVLEELY